MQLTAHQAKFIAHDLTLQHSGGGLDRLSPALFNPAPLSSLAIAGTLSVIKQRLEAGRNQKLQAQGD